jgi:hypothetical protein
MSQKPIHTDRPFMQRASNCHLLTESPTNSDLHKNFPFLFSPTNQTPKSSIPHLISERATDAIQNSQTRNCKPHQDCKPITLAKVCKVPQNFGNGCKVPQNFQIFAKLSAKLLNFFGKVCKENMGKYIFGNRNGSAENSKCLT